MSSHDFMSLLHGLHYQIEKLPLEAVGNTYYSKAKGLKAVESYLG